MARNMFPEEEMMRGYDAAEMRELFPVGVIYVFDNVYEQYLGAAFGYCELRKWLPSAEITCIDINKDGTANVYC